MNLLRENEVRCWRCDRLLATGTIGKDGKLKIRCPRCRTDLTLRAPSTNSEPHDGPHGDRHALKTPPHHV